MVDFFFGIVLGVGITLAIGILLRISLKPAPALPDELELEWQVKNAIARGTESTIKCTLERICALPLCEDCKRAIG
jgi:hypothetical protein